MVKITKEIVEKLIKNQFPQWGDLEIKEVEKSGHDNRTFHLGSEMNIRFPSDKCYVSQVEKELEWLPKLKEYLNLKISEPIAKGNPGEGYPWSWSINKWITGDTVSYDNIRELKEFAIDLAEFLKELQWADCTNGPIAGEHNFFRGGLLEVYDNETKEALNNLKDELEVDKLYEIWKVALKSRWVKEDVWVHGDIAPGNLLCSNGKLCGVIDFGILGVGDPSCDYAMGWTFFDDDSRNVFFGALGCDNEVRDRARGWALWKALITYDRNSKESNLAIESKKTIYSILNEYESNVNI